MKLFNTVLIAAAFATAAPTALVADEIGDAIKARQGYYKLIRANAGPLFGMAKGEVEYDAERAQMLASNLVTLTAMKNGELWPQGSDKASRPGETRALPAIWETYPAVAEKGKALVSASAALADAAGGGLDGLREKIGGLGGACKACHDDFRAKDF
ncbi:MAG: cytochrome c [Rhodobacteraceae bacterium]|nr:cytochrome c [Paracoccaceae bacterium]